MVRKLFADTFYDKEYIKYTKTTTIDDEGWVIDTSDNGTVFYGNGRYTKLEELQQSYGIKEDISLAISTHETAQLGDLIGDGENIYRVTAFYKFDTHNLIILTDDSQGS